VEPTEWKYQILCEIACDKYIVERNKEEQLEKRTIYEISIQNKCQIEAKQEELVREKCETQHGFEEIERRVKEELTLSKLI
jgi:hypothetical protein